MANVTVYGTSAEVKPGGAIQDSLDTVQGTGGTVLAQPGYQILPPGGLTIPPHVHLQGRQLNSTILISKEDNNANKAIVWLTGEQAGLSDVTIIGTGNPGNVSGINLTPTAATAMNSPAYCHIKRVRIVDAPSFSIFIHGGGLDPGDVCIFNHFEQVRCEHTAGGAAPLAPGGNLLIQAGSEGNSFTDCQFNTETGFAVDLQSCRSTVFNHCIIERAGDTNNYCRIWNTRNTAFRDCWYESGADAGNSNVANQADKLTFYFFEFVDTNHNFVDDNGHYVFNHATGPTIATFGSRIGGPQTNRQIRFENPFIYVAQQISGGVPQLQIPQNNRSDFYFNWPNSDEVILVGGRLVDLQYVAADELRFGGFGANYGLPQMMRIGSGPGGRMKLPSLTTAQRLALPNAFDGEIVYDATLGQYWGMTGGVWTHPLP